MYIKVIKCEEAKFGAMVGARHEAAYHIMNLEMVILKGF